VHLPHLVRLLNCNQTSVGHVLDQRHNANRQKERVGKIFGNDVHWRTHGPLQNSGCEKSRGGENGRIEKDCPRTFADNQGGGDTFECRNKNRRRPAIKQHRKKHKRVCYANTTSDSRDFDIDQQRRNCLLVNLQISNAAAISSLAGREFIAFMLVLK